MALAYGWPGPRVFLRLCGWYVALNLLLAGAAGLAPLISSCVTLPFIFIYFC